MQIEKIKRKPWLENLGTGSLEIGSVIKIYTFEKKEITIDDINKIVDFFKSLNK